MTEAELPRWGAGAPTVGGVRPSASPVITSDAISRTARELVAAYGRGALALMRRRICDVGRRGDADAAQLWRRIAAAVECELSAAEAAADGSRIPRDPRDAHHMTAVTATALGM